MVGSFALEHVLPKPDVSERDLKLMHRIDEIHLDAPFFGARTIPTQLRREG